MEVHKDDEVAEVELVPGIVVHATYIDFSGIEPNKKGWVGATVRVNVAAVRRALGVVRLPVGRRRR